MYDDQTWRYLDDKIRQGFGEYSVPSGIQEGLRAYLLTGRPTGSFLEAVISNDLIDACKRADVINRFFLFNIVTFLYNVAPANSFGSRENYRAYVERGRSVLNRTLQPDDETPPEGPVCPRCGKLRDEVMARDGDVEYCGFCGYGKP